MAGAGLLAGCLAMSTPTPSPPPVPAPARSTGPADRTPQSPAPGGADGPHEQRFAEWLERFRAKARTAGLGVDTLATALDGVRYLPRVIELDRSQPESTRTVWEYLDSAVSAARVARGREQLLTVRAEADAAATRDGVPAAVLVAVWGIESNYGSNYGDIPTLDALATLAFEGRREQWASGELLAALRILERGDIDRARMVGSWAGAMGQTQFLPSVFLAHAVDADGDGRRDLWGSMADAMASTARFLAYSGWQADQPWGVEVVLPAGFDAARADPLVRQAAARWAAEGVRSTRGPVLPEVGEASILLPAGVRGPAFLTGANFRAILRYNDSTSYALAVGLLSQRLAGGPGVQAPWPRDLAALTRSQLQQLQTLLNARGFDSGSPDGVMGPATRSGVRGLQRSLGLPADGFPTLDLLQRVQAP